MSACPQVSGRHEMAIMTAAPASALQPRSLGRHDVRGIVRLTWKPAVLAAFACWVLAVGAHHEAWGDESQAWLLARDSSLADLLFHRIRYEGSPGLWHALLWLCIKAGLPYAQLYLISTLCSIAGAAIILWRAPFPAVLRVAVIASYFFAYQYSVVARSYALDLVLVPALAAVFDRRVERPVAYGVLIGLLANSNAHSCIAAAVLGCEFALALFRTGQWRTWQGTRGLGASAVLGLFAVACAWEPADNGFSLLTQHPSALLVALSFVNEAFIDRVSVWDTQVPSLIDLQDGLKLSLVVLIPSFLLIYRAKMMPLAAALFGYIIGFSTWKYGIAWHAGLVFLLWLFLLWISWPALSTLPVLRYLVPGSLALVCTAQAVEAARSGLWDVANPYSAAPQAAIGIAKWRDLHRDGRIAALGFKTVAVQPFFPSNIFANYRGGASDASYVRWGRVDIELWKPFPSAREWEAISNRGFDLLVASTLRLAPQDLAERSAPVYRAGYQLIARYPGHMQWKGYEWEDDSLLLFARTDGAKRARE
jgi:hypothetical protein